MHIGGGGRVRTRGSAAAAAAAIVPRFVNKNWSLRYGDLGNIKRADRAKQCAWGISSSKLCQWHYKAQDKKIRYIHKQRDKPSLGLTVRDRPIVTMEHY